MTRLTWPLITLLISVLALVLAWPMAALAGGGPQKGYRGMLMLIVGYRVAGLGLIVRERGRRSVGWQADASCRGLGA
jgi:hypothetical protein